MGIIGSDSSRLIGSSFGVPQNATYDYIVVGGGNAGLTVAARLAEDSSISVAVIEAGTFYEIANGNLSQIPAYDTYWSGKDPDNDSPVDWGFVTTPQNGLLNASVHYARGKALGGCSARNYMAYHMGTIESYEKWANQVGDYSYTYDGLLPYFQKSLNFTPPGPSRATNATPNYDEASLGPGDGPLSVTFSNYANAVSSWVEKGFAAIGIKPIQGFTSGALNGSAYVLETINAADQTRESSETAFLQPALESTSLKVYQSTLAKKVLFDSEKTANGVLVESDGVHYVLSANREVIVSAGAFQSPQLLMVSGVGPKASLEKHNIPVVADRPGVGQNMWDHVLMGPTYRVNAITSSSLANPDALNEANDLFINKQEGILTNSGGDFLAWEKIPSSYRSSWPNNTLSALTQFPSDWPEVEYLSMSGFLGYQQNYQRDAPTDGYNYATVSTALVAPSSRGTIDISSADMADAPLINPNWLTHPADQEIVVAGYKRVREMFNSTVMEDVLIGPEYFPGEDVQSDAEILEVIRKTASTVYHAACTCAMGKEDDKKAVIDTKARVYGVKGLRVVDASSFPILPPGHPVATIYALAEKIAHDILSS
ncbi:GMC family oxidoreductase [Aspergillus ruber CBS 135680]|uniref:GMC oxidoreductase-like protein n=1 Tax=Aspergillus ruber (strain CBS 135680) TaxID=1388766 RepID=A0A017S633_ASPRC|nr:GMC oxidoreductase-like protein [Aspergillus ruber CBS 135680]EYE92427.1 GMC oxidoreductase-like protein [Aspergillus ruber CBS 135680]